MDNKTFIIKSITLLFLESQLPNYTDRSQDLVKTGVERLERSKAFEPDAFQPKDAKTTLQAMKDYLVGMYSSPEDRIFSAEEILQDFRIILKDDEKLYDALEQGLNNDYSDSTIKRLVVSIRRSIQNHYKEAEIGDILNMAQREFVYNRSSIKDVPRFISDLMDRLEPLTLNQTAKDPAIMGEVDVDNEESIGEAFSSVKNNNNGDNILRFGWHAYNRACQGGIRRGEFMFTPALQHRYKTGTNLTLFSQVARYNTPVPKDPTKKPLLLRISFEDSIASNMQFLYQQIRYTETREMFNIDDVSPEEMARYVKQKLSATGFHVKFIRVDPSQWTYKHICNKILEFESQGYEIFLLSLDYLSHVPPVGCKQGPAGTDLRDMFRRIRNFCAAKDIAVMTPHQLSTESKMLLRAGTSDLNFVKEINEKGYYTDSKQLDQEIDLEVYQHIAKVNKKHYLVFMRGKHRLPTVLDEEHRYFMYEFPKGMPIPDDIDGEDASFTKPPPPERSAFASHNANNYDF